jgi:hypothetical protein
VLNVTSQQWLDPSRAYVPGHGSIWTHQVIVVIPKKLKHKVLDPCTQPPPTSTLLHTLALSGSSTSSSILVDGTPFGLSTHPVRLFHHYQALTCNAMQCSAVHARTNERTNEHTHMLTCSHAHARESPAAGHCCFVHHWWLQREPRSPRQDGRGASPHRHGRRLCGVSAWLSLCL